VSGDIWVYGGLYHLEDYYSPSYNDNGHVYGAAARANFWLGQNLSAQVGVNAEQLHYPGGSYDYHTANISGHVSHRDSTYLFGAFGSVGMQSENWWDTTFATVGVEGQIYSGPVQLYVQTGITGGPNDGDQIIAYYIHGEARHFVNPNLMLAANAGGFWEEYDGPDDPIHGFRWGADIETKLNGSGVGGFLSYQGNYENEPSEGESWAVHSVLLGAKLHFNNDTLQSAAIDGATLKDFNPLTGDNHSRFNDWE
jgi:hypothetical protein